MRPLHRNMIGLAGFFGLWEAAVRLDLVKRVFLPTPTDVALRLVDLLGHDSFVRDVIATVLAWLVAVGVTVVIAVPAGVVLGGVRWIRTASRMLIEFLRPIPPVALVPLAVMAFGSGPEAKVMLAVYAAVWPVLFNTIAAFDEVDPLLEDTARSFGWGRLRVLASVALPQAWPFIFTGLRQSAAIALLVVVSTEYLAGSQIGIGAFFIQATSTVGGMDEVLAATVVIGIIGVLANHGVERLGQRLFPWSPTTRADRAA